MAEEFFKGLGRYIPPEIRRFAPAVKTVAELLRPTQIVKNPAVSNLVRSPSLANVGNVLSNAAMTAAEVVPGGKLVTTPVKKASKLVDDLLKKGDLKKASKMTDDPLNLMSIKRDRRDSIRDAKSKKYSVNDVIKNPNTSINKVLLEMGDEKISTMTVKEAVEYIRKKGVNVAYSTIGAKKLNFKASKGTGSGNKTDKLNEAFNSIENPNQYTVEELKNLPQIQKIINENNISFETFNRVRRKSGIESKPITFIDTFNVNEDEFINFLQQNPKATLTQIKANFPKIKKLSYEQLKNWRDSKNISKITNKKDKTILQETNPRLQSQLDFVSQSGDKVLPSNIPIKHNEAFSEIITMNKKTGPLDATRTKIVQAHGIGEGGISNTSKEIIKSKVAMIPEDFLKDEKLPQFFLTRSGNIKHRDIENNLILALVNKYDKLGYNFVEGAWKQTKKVNPKSITKELKNLENEIAGYQDELNKLDAYTLFYNPVKE
jgi:translation elongation factor EF-1beta